jgi:hypothetical protein
MLKSASAAGAVAGMSLVANSCATGSGHSRHAWARRRRTITTKASAGTKKLGSDPAWDKDPSVNYPTNVATGDVGKLTLYALGPDLTVRDLYQEPFARVLESAIDRVGRIDAGRVGIALSDQGREEAVAALEALRAVIAEIENDKPDDKDPSASRRPITLEFLCTTPSTEWSPTPVLAYGLKMRAREALNFVALPFMRVDNAMATEFLGTKYEGVSFFDLLEETTIADLFMRAKNEFSTELQDLIPQARRIGLLWCYPVGYWQQRQAELAYAVARRRGRQTDRYNSVTLTVRRSAGRVSSADGTASLPAFPDDYCQIVNGRCNLLSDQKTI